jgi:hypothetical protein
MKVYLIILLIHINSAVSQLLNNESLLVFSIYGGGIFKAKFSKIKSQLNESDSNFVDKVKTHRIREIDFSLKANIIVWRDLNDTFYAIPIDQK